MENLFITINDLKTLYPDEWILLGNPKIENTAVLGGIVLFHSKDKKEVCYLGRDKVSDYSTVTITYAGNIKHNRRLGILKRI